MCEQIGTLFASCGDVRIAEEARVSLLDDEIREAQTWAFRRAACHERDRCCYRVVSAVEPRGGLDLDDVALTGLDCLGLLEVLLSAAIPTLPLNGLLKKLLASEVGEPSLGCMASLALAVRSVSGRDLSCFEQGQGSDCAPADREHPATCRDRRHASSRQDRALRRARMHGRSHVRTGKGGRYRYYNCEHRVNRSASACSLSPIRAETLDNAVLGAIERRLLDPEHLRQSLAGLIERSDTADARRRKALMLARQARTEAQKAFANLLALVEWDASWARDPMNVERFAANRAHERTAANEVEFLERQFNISRREITPEMIDAFANALKAKLRNEAAVPIGLAECQLLTRSDIRAFGDLEP